MTKTRATLLRFITATSGYQTFLGAPWVSAALALTPHQFRRRMALPLLSLSPHYFFGNDLDAEEHRSWVSREEIVRDLLLPHLGDDLDVLDYGCGAGYMAKAAASFARHIYAIDMSAGVLACARELNAAPNVEYLTPADFESLSTGVDLIYSFAVVQHLTDRILSRTLSLFGEWLRPGGKLIIHFANDGSGWRTEAQWRADQSLQGRLRMRFGLNCFGRSDEAMRELIWTAGLKPIEITPLHNKTAVDDDIASQHILFAQQPTSRSA